MSVTGHKSLQSLFMCQRVKSDEKMMIGMSLAKSLCRPIEVKQSLKDAIKFDVEELTPNIPEKHALDPYW